MTSSGGPAGEAGRPTFSFRLENDLGDLSRLLALLQEFGETHNVLPGDVQPVILSVDELVTNVIQYGNRDGENAEIRIRATVGDGVFRIEIEDHGIPFDPFQEAPVPDTTLPLEERPIGGLGVFLVQSLMTSTHYERIDDRNRITLTRALAAGPEEEEAQ